MEILEKLDYLEFEEFNSAHPKGHFLQSVKWANIKSNWTHEIIVSRDKNGKIVGGISVLINKMRFFPYSMMYAGRGPVCDPNDKAVIADLFNGIRALSKKHKAFTFKMDPDITADNQEFFNTVKDLGFKVKNNYYNLEGVHPRFVFRLYIKGRTEDEVFAAMHQKTRYNIRVGLKHNVEVKLCDDSMMDTFYELMLKTAQRDGFALRSKSFFQSIYDGMGDNARIYFAFYEGKPIVCAMPIIYGGKVWGYHGGSDDDYRNVMPNYVMNWELIKMTIKEGCEFFDFRGVSGNITDTSSRLYGLFRFKKGFGGDLMEFVGECDYEFKPLFSLMFHLANGMRQKILTFNSKAKARVKKVGARAQVLDEEAKQALKAKEQ